MKPTPPARPAAAKTPGAAPAFAPGRLRLGPVRRAREEERKRAEDNQTSELRRAREDLRLIQEQVNEFEKAAGLRIADRWSHPQPEAMGRAVRYILDGGLKSERAELESLRARAKRALEGIEQALEVAS